MPVPTANSRVPFDTVYENEHVLVVAKPRGRVTLPGRGHDHDTLLNGVFASHGRALARLGARRDYGLLHRLDRATSGLVVFARTAEAYDRLRKAFADRRVVKTYLTIVRGRLPGARGVLRKRLRQERRGDLLVSVCDPRGVEAVTRWQRWASGSGRHLVTCQIETGRLHQIRAHLAALGTPVEGDTVYGVPSAPDARASASRRADRSLLLHAWKLEFPDPAGGSPVRVEVAPPQYFRQAAQAWGLDWKVVGRAPGPRAPGARGARGRND